MKLLSSERASYGVTGVDLRDLDSGLPVAAPVRCELPSDRLRRKLGVPGLESYGLDMAEG